MEVFSTKLESVLLIKPPTIFEDFRGHYIETYNRKAYFTAGIPIDFILFALTLLGVALFHNATLYVALTGLVTISLYKILFTGFTRFQRAQATQLPLDRNANRMGHFAHLLCDFHVVLI